MAKQIFLSGHGGWKPEYGYTNVPKNCKIHFYTPFAKNLVTGMEYLILEGKYNMVDRTINEFMQCPNMLLSFQDEEWTRASRNSLLRRNDANCELFSPDNQDMPLNKLFEKWSERYQNVKCEFHWLACQTLELNKVGGRSFGLNAAYFNHDPQMGKIYRIKVTKVGGIEIYDWR